MIQNSADLRQLLIDAEEVIAAGVGLRTRLSEIIASEAPEQETANARSAASALFRIPWPFDEPTELKAYDPFVPGVQIGFDAACAPKIIGEQRVSSEPDPPPGCHFEFVVDVVDHGESDWISLELISRACPQPKRAIWTVAARLSASSPGEIAAAVFAADQNGRFHRIELGSKPVGTEMRSFALSGLVDLAAIEGFDPDAPLRLVLFLPVGANYALTLSHMDLFISERPDDR